MWTFVPTPDNMILMDALERQLDGKRLQLNRSALINRALQELFQRMEVRLHLNSVPPR